MVDTNIEKLVMALKFASSSDVKEMKEAEGFLKQRKALPEYLVQLLMISQNVELGNSIRLLAAIQLKNFVEINWKFGPDEQHNKSLVFNPTDDIIVISDKEKTLFRKEIISVIGNCENKTILKTLVESVSQPIKYDLKTWQEEFVAGIAQLLDSKKEEKIYAGLSIFYQASKLYEYDTKKDIYKNILTGFFNGFTTFADNLKDKLDNEIGMIILKKILKIVLKSIQSEMPGYLLDNSNFERWLVILLTIIDNLKGSDVNTSEENMVTNYWKVGVHATLIINRLYQKYIYILGNESEVLKNFSNNLSKKYSKEVLKVMFALLEKSKGTKFPDKIICMAFKFFTAMIKKGLLIEEFTPRISLLLDNFIVHNIMLSKKDLSLRKEDHKDYILKQFDYSLTFHDKRFACCQFIKVLAEYGVYDINTKKVVGLPFFKTIFDYVKILFQNYEKEAQEGKSPSPLIKEAAMTILETISPVVLTQVNSNEIEELIKLYVLKELNVENTVSLSGVVKEKACFVIKVYSKIEYQDHALLESIVKNLCNLLSDQDLSIRIFTSLTLPHLMNKPYVLGLLQNYIKNLLEVYLNLMNQIDLEELLTGLEQIIDKFGDGVKDYAIELTQELVRQFDRLIHTNIEEDGGEAQMAAEGVLTALQRIIIICSNNDKLLDQIEVIVSPVIRYGFSSEGFEVLDDVIETVRILLSKPSKISQTTWSYFTCINFSIIGDEDENKTVLAQYPGTSLEGIAYDNLSDVLSLLHLYITRDPETLLTSVDSFKFPHVDRLFQTLYQIFKNGTITNDYEGSVHATRCLISFFDSIILINSKGGSLNVNKQAEEVLNLISTTLLKLSPKHSHYKTVLLQLLSSLLLYNTNLTMDVLFKLKVIENIISIWFNHIPELRMEYQLNKNLYGLTCLINIISLYSQYNIKSNEILPVLMEKVVYVSDKIYKSQEKKQNKKEEKEDDGEDALDRCLALVSLSIIFKGEAEYGQRK